MQLTIDTDTDTYEQAIAAVQAAYGLRPVPLPTGRNHHRSTHAPPRRT